MNREFPWADLDSPVYIGIQQKQRKNWVIVYAWFCVAVMVVCAFLTRYHFVCALLAVILALATVTKRTEAVTERGLESFTDAKLFAGDELWTWDEIEALTYETNPSVPDTTLLFFTKGPRTRKAFFKDEDVVMIKVLAKKKNKNINIYNGNEFRAQEKAYSASQRRRKK